jgi:regulator of sirC expression with transglutaminase-like and TPR domain
MKSASASIGSVNRLPESQKSALLTLLADDDPVVYQTVREKILLYGTAACEWLRPHTLSGDPVLRRRVREIIRFLEQQTADNGFLAFCLKTGQEFDLEEGAWLLAQTQYPGINIDAYRALLDSYANDLRERVDFAAQPKQILSTLNYYLFFELGFKGNEDNYYDPENSYLNRVIDRRTGNPINLCLLYLLLGRRLRLPIAGIGLPGHFVCRYQSTSAEIYVDVFHRGKILTKADCVQYLVQANFGLRDEFLVPVTPRRLMLRICSNLRQIYLQLDQPDEVARFQHYLVALSR